METTNESTENAAPAPAENGETSAADPAAPDLAQAKRADGMPVGRPFQPGVCANPGGRPKDPIAALVREATCDGADVVTFLVAVVKDEVDGRIADKGGMIDRLLADAGVLEKRAKRLEEEAGIAVAIVAPDVKKLREEAADLKARAEGLRARLARKRKIAVPVKTRVAAAEVLLERGWGKAVERVDLTVGNPDGSPIGGDGHPLPEGPLAHLNGEDLAAIGEVLDRAAKRTEVVEVAAEPAP